MAQGLLEFETLSGEEVEALLKGEPIFRPEEDVDNSPAKGSVPASGNVDNAQNNKENHPVGSEPQPQN